MIKSEKRQMAHPEDAAFTCQWQCMPHLAQGICAFHAYYYLLCGILITAFCVVCVGVSLLPSVWDFQYCLLCGLCRTFITAFCLKLSYLHSVSNFPYCLLCQTFTSSSPSIFLGREVGLDLLSLKWHCMIVGRSIDAFTSCYTTAKFNEQV